MAVPHFQNPFQTNPTTTPFASVQIWVCHAQIYLRRARSPSSPCSISLVMPWSFLAMPRSVFFMCNSTQIYHLRSQLYQDLLPAISTETRSASSKNRFYLIQSDLLFGRWRVRFSATQFHQVDSGLGTNLTQTNPWIALSVTNNTHFLCLIFYLLFFVYFWCMLLLGKEKIILFKIF